MSLAAVLQARAGAGTRRPGPAHAKRPGAHAQPQRAASPARSCGGRRATSGSGTSASIASRRTSHRKDTPHEDLRPHGHPHRPRLRRRGVRCLARSESPGGLWFGVERAIVNTVVDGLVLPLGRARGRSGRTTAGFVRLERGRRDRVHVGLRSNPRPGVAGDDHARSGPRGDRRSRCATSTCRDDDDGPRAHRYGWAWYLDVLAERFEKVAATTGVSRSEAG